MVETLNFDEDKTLKYFTYVYYLNTSNMKLGKYSKFLGTLESFDISEKKFIMVLNNTQI